MELTLPLSDAHVLERTECFLAWLIPRAAAVHKLTIIAERGDAASPPQPAGGGAQPQHSSPQVLQMVWQNLVSALTLAGASLKSLTLEWPDDLQLSQWVGTLQALEVRGQGGDGGGVWVDVAALLVQVLTDCGAAGDAAM